MQKVLQRTALAQRQARHKAAKIEQLEAQRDRRAWDTEVRKQRHNRLVAVKEAKRRVKEEWELGALASWTEGNPAHAPLHGTFDISMLSLPDKAKADQTKDWFVRPGDRVCIVKGPERVRGRIGVISSIDEESDAVFFERINEIVVRVPPNPAMNSTVETITRPSPVPLSDVRLVYPLPDPQTGVPRDVLLNNLVKKNKRFDVFENKEIWDRYLEPQHIRIPWPDVTEEPPEDTDSDTLRIAVEEKTFLPTLLRPPMPGGVIDELRGRYSKFRTRHDEDWVQMKEAEDEQEQRMHAISRTMVPNGATNMLRSDRIVGAKSQGSEKQSVSLDEQTLQRIGEYMVKQGKTSADAVVTEGVPLPDDSRPPAPA